MSTPPLNPTSLRFPFNLAGKVHPEVENAIRWCFNGFANHEQAFRNIKANTGTFSTTTNESVSETTGVEAFNSETGEVSYFPNLGAVNNQLGVLVYTTQSQDNGAKIIVGDSSAIAVTLNSSVTAPWFTLIDNDSSATASLNPSSGSLFGASSIPGFGFGIVFFDGSNFWCGSSLGTRGFSGTITTAKLTVSGAQGSQTYVDGLLTSQVQAT